MDNNLYSSGTFAKKCHVTKKTLRYYNDHNILKPSYIDEKGNHYYSDDDFIKLQQILFFKYLGFSLDDIKELCIHTDDKNYLSSSLKMQSIFIDEKIKQFNAIKLALNEATNTLKDNNTFNSSELMNLIDNTVLDEKLKTQYLNSKNLNARINLHHMYSTNPQDWFSFIFDNLNLKPKEKVLELGCGNGSLWVNQDNKIIKKCDITISDISEGMVEDAKRNINNNNIKYQLIDINYLGDIKDESYDVIIANHVLFYLDDLSSVLKQIKRILKVGGRLITSTYSKNHMKEISELVSSFDNRIMLSKNNLYEIFGKENGNTIFKKYFDEVTWIQYDDELLINNSDILIEYILSCHGNQNRYIIDRYKEFKEYVENNIKNGLKITKDAGIFISKRLK